MKGKLSEVSCVLYTSRTFPAEPAMPRENAVTSAQKHAATEHGQVRVAVAKS